MKIFIIAPEHIDKLEVANALVALDDNLNICKTFVSINNDANIAKYVFFLDIDDILLSFKNNALLFIDYNDELITGITLDDYDISDIIPILPKHFNSIVDKYVKDDVLLVLLDTKSADKNQNDITENKYVQERVDEFEIPLIYFVDEKPEEIAKTIISYINGSEEERKNIIYENS